MKKVININFQGRVIPIEESAYDILKAYIETLRQYFEGEEGKEEIINDIESRIAELFSAMLQKDSTCITDQNVETVIQSMGRPEDFEEENPTKEKQPNPGTKFTSTTWAKLHRDEKNKLFGGVCAGIAAYFGIDPLIVRILAVLTAGISFLPYILLWIALPNQSQSATYASRKRLFRDTDNKMIAGVCAGLAQYFNIKIWVPRLLFLLPFVSIAFNFHHFNSLSLPNFINLSFSPGATIIYIIFWLILPEALTTSEKLEMRGEPVDLNSIRQTIQSDMEGFKQRAERFGNDIKQRAEAFSGNINYRYTTYGNQQTAHRPSGLGHLLALLAKILFYLILGSILFVVTIVLFAIGIVFLGLIFPAKDFIFNGTYETTLATLTLVLFIWIPIIGIITWFIRRIANIKHKKPYMRWAFSILWTLGWVCLVLFIKSMSDDLRYRNAPQQQTIVLPQPKVDYLEVMADDFGKNYDYGDFFKFNPFLEYDEDTVTVKNVRIKIVQAPSDSFWVSLAKFSNGFTKQEANAGAAHIDFQVAQKDSFLKIDKGIQIKQPEKFRNQRVIMTIAIPIGKRIKIDKNVDLGEEFIIGLGKNSDWDNDDDNNAIVNHWRPNVEYIMSATGLKKVHPQDILDKDGKDCDDCDGSDDNNDDEDNAIEQFKKSKEQLKKEVEKKQLELERQQRELDKKRKELLESPIAPEAPKKKMEKSNALLKHRFKRHGYDLC